MIAHIVLFNLRPGVSESALRVFAQELRVLLRKAPSLARANIGRAAVVDPGYERSFGDKTYNLAAILEFHDEEGLLEYLRDPLHEEVGRKFWEYCDGTTIAEMRMADWLDDRNETEDLLVK